MNFVAGEENVVLLGPPGTGKTHLSTETRRPQGAHPH
ncbi:ATP-binding protein [Lentzea sp. NPDC004782]